MTSGKVGRIVVLLLPWWLRVGADGSREWDAAAGAAVPEGFVARVFDVLTCEIADDRARYAVLGPPPARLRRRRRGHGSNGPGRHRRR